MCGVGVDVVVVVVLGQMMTEPLFSSSLNINVTDLRVKNLLAFDWLSTCTAGSAGNVTATLQTTSKVSALNSVLNTVVE